jgi:serine O-acetyltransferase
MLAEDMREKARLKYSSDSRGALIKALTSDGSLSMVLYRLMQGSHDMGIPVVSGSLELIFNRLNSMFGGAVIGRGADFGPGFVLIYSNGVVINGRVKGGERVHIHHEVTIGDDLEGDVPTLGSDIHIGAGAKVIGGVIVGDGARIGANAVVVHDVEANTTVVGIPARAVRRRAKS